MRSKDSNKICDSFDAMKYLIGNNDILRGILPLQNGIERALDRLDVFEGKNWNDTDNQAYFKRLKDQLDGTND